jgi:NAD(P)-dependent dehydrogenase (short-subunit alcohol dehydrogenase family)
MKDLKGRTAVITGAASGIGLATARVLAGQGMKIVLADIEDEALSAAEAEFAKAGHEVLAVRTDVSQWQEVETLAARAVERFGAVHVVHNNAGVVIAGEVAEIALTDWEWVLGVDLWGVIHGVKAFVPLIEAAGEGHIINTASTAGFHATPTIAPYNVAKFGVVAITETLRRELDMKKSPIGASVLCPGAIDTGIVDSDRNRPAGSEPASKAHERFQNSARDMIAKGLPPSLVADLVLAAIRDNRFWIVTHPRWIEVLRERIEGMADNGRLGAGNGG